MQNLTPEMLQQLFSQLQLQYGPPPPTSPRGDMQAQAIGGGMGGQLANAALQAANAKPQRGSLDIAPQAGSVGQQMTQPSQSGGTSGLQGLLDQMEFLKQGQQGGGVGRAAFDAPGFQPKPIPMDGAMGNIAQIMGNSPMIPRKPNTAIAKQAANQGASQAGKAGLQRVSPGVYRNAQGSLTQKKAGK